mgnify:FL=1
MSSSSLERIDNITSKNQFENRLHPSHIKLSQAMATSAAVVSFHMGEYETSIDSLQSLQIMLGLGMGNSITVEPKICSGFSTTVHVFFVILKFWNCISSGAHELECIIVLGWNRRPSHIFKFTQETYWPIRRSALLINSIKVAKSK